MKTLTEEKFDSAISREKVLICFSSSWCQPCKKVIEILEEIEGDQSPSFRRSVGQFQIYKFIIDKADNMIDRFDVSKVPMLVLFENGKEMRRLVGLKTKKDIQKFLLE
jgi:thioredoxin 1